MLHPSPPAVDYIWNKLQDAMFVPSCAPAVAKLESLSRAVHHRAFDAASPEHQVHVLVKFVDLIYDFVIFSL